MSSTTEDTHMDLWRDENRIGATEDQWLGWIAEVEHLLGHSADGDQKQDGYSMDSFYEKFEAGQSPAEALR